MAEFDYADLIENMYDGMYFVDTDRKITYWNKAASRITGFNADEVQGKSCSDNILIHIDGKGENLCEGMCPLAETIKDGISREAEVYLHHRDGHRVPVLVRVSPLRDPDGRIIGGAELFTDLSQRDSMGLKIEELEKLAFLDKLTQLPNRHYIEFELEGRLAEMGRYGLSFGLLIMDIDHFKGFNDTYGHDVGDTVLKTVANTLMTNARPYDLFGRWGGEEFIGIIRDVDLPALSGIGERVRILVEKSHVQTAESILSVTISLGGTMAIAGDSIESLIKRADNLLYESKQKGRNRLTIDKEPL
jgi:diguanylate cyclase (GGDEF)-like protein/PAS domain S-box-containing protein